MIGFLSGIFKWWRVIAVVAVLLAVGGSIYAVYRYVDNLQTENVRLAAENSTLVANMAQLENALESQQNTIDSLQEDIELQGRLLTRTSRDFQEARDAVSRLRERLSEHELGFLASERPGLVENIINDASDEISRCFEIASGSPLTQEELDATLPSEINSECPELANPNYRGDQ